MAIPQQPANPCMPLSCSFSSHYSFVYSAYSVHFVLLRHRRSLPNWFPPSSMISDKLQSATSDTGPPPCHISLGVITPPYTSLQLHATTCLLTIPPFCNLRQYFPPSTNKSRLSPHPTPTGLVASCVMAGMEPRKTPPEYFLEIFADTTHVRDVLKG